MTDEERIRIGESEGYLWFQPPDGSNAYLQHLTDRSRDKPIPTYDTLDSIQRAVLAQDAEFQDSFAERILLKAQALNAHCHALDSGDWCDCFIAVLDERSGK